MTPAFWWSLTVLCLLAALACLLAAAALCLGWTPGSVR